MLCRSRHSLWCKGTSNLIVDYPIHPYTRIAHGTHTPPAACALTNPESSSVFHGATMLHPLFAFYIPRTHADLPWWGYEMPH